MKKVITLVLSVVLMFAVLPLNAFSYDYNSIIDISFADTYVYDGMQGDNGKFNRIHVKYTITFEDGSTHEVDQIGYSNSGVEIQWGTLYLSDNQDTELWEVGNTYLVTGSIGEFSNTFNVEVRENPIQEISVDDFCIIKSNEYFSEENGEVYRICNLMNSWHPCNVTYKDGSNESVGEQLYLPDQSTWVDVATTCAIPYEDWESGSTHEVTATLLGVSDTFNVTLLEVESITAEDVKRIQNFDGYMDGYWDENDNYVGNAWFRYDIYPDSITVTFTNGSFISGNSSEIAEYTGSHPNCYSDQSYENQWSLGNHSATIELGGCEQDYTVEVVETPIKDILVDDITHIEGTNGEKASDYNPDTGNYDLEYYRYSFNPHVTVTFKDGTVLENDGGIRYNGEWYGLNYNDDQSYENQWGVGIHTVPASILGFDTSFNVSITESPVESIEIQDISVIEYTHGYEGGDGNYIYSNINPSFKVTLKDGREFSSNGSNGIDIDGEWYSLTVYTDSQHENNWVTGNTYQVTGSISGVSNTFNVTIVETPVESIEIQDISVIEYTHGYEYGDGNYIYNNIYPSFKVTFKDGRKLSSNGSSGIDIDGEWYSLTVYTDSQHENNWVTSNTYQVTGSILGVSNTFNVTIVETPVESLEIKDISIVGNTNGYESESGYIYSDINPAFTVTLKDGRKFSSNGSSGINIDGDWYYFWVDTDSQYENNWTVGNTYQVTGSILGASSTFNVTIIENPVESISAVAKRDLMQDIDCDIWKDENGIEHSYYNLYNLFEYTVIYDGGKVFTGDVKEIEEKFGYWISICDEQSEGNQFVLGKNTVEIVFIGVRCTAEFNITERLYKAVEISGENELTVTFTKTDNTKVSAQVINFEESDGGLGVCGGTLETTAGTFYADFYWKTEETDDNAFEYQNEDLQLVIGKLESNKINCNYIKALLYCHEFIDCKSYFEGTGENYFSFNNKNYTSLEALAWIACRFNGTGWSGDYITNGYKKYYLLDVDTVKNSIKEVFGVEADVTASEDYDAETGKYRWFYYYYYSDNYNYRKIKFENGIWTYKQISEDNQGICIKLNEDFTVNSINMCNKETHAITEIFREDATCTTDGFILSECDICGEIVEEVIPAIEHNYKEEVIEATEASNGKIVYTCENCGHSYTEIIPSVGQHDFVVIKEKDSTCTSLGYIVYKCSLCGETKTEKKAALPHSYKIKSKIDATYTHMGQITSECEHCGARNIEIVYAFCDFNKDGLLNQSDYNAFDIKTADISLFDFDKNGEVNEFDTIIIKHLTNNTAFTDIIDINGDGKSDIKDLVRAKKILAGIIPEDDNNDADKNLDGNTTAEDIIFVRKFILTIDLKLYT